MNYQEAYHNYLSAFQADLEECCKIYLPDQSDVCKAAKYSLLAGGKRVRAILAMSVCEMLGGNLNIATRFACAVEMLHCYSLIHDDLPCMDNDDFRRGKLSCHKAFGESTAMLAGDTLLTEAFEVISDTDVDAASRVRAVKALALGAGSRGMVWGQELDLKYEQLSIDEQMLRKIHNNKTGALINAAVQLGVAAANGSLEDEKQLSNFAYDLGLVFQIIDDVLDVLATSEELGKPIGSDAENGKTTFQTLYGTEKALEQAKIINDEMCSRLKNAYGDKAEFLIALSENLLTRRN